MTDDRLTVIDGGQDHGPVVRSRRRPPARRFCAHGHLELDADLRRSYCADCGDEVDNFTALLTLCSDWDRQVYRTQEAERAADDLEKRVRALKRELAGLRKERRAIEEVPAKRPAKAVADPRL